MSWDQADAVSDKIVDMLNKELRRKGSRPMQVLAGLMLGMCAFASTCPKADAPEPFIDVMNAIQRCLSSMMAESQS